MVTIKDVAKKANVNPSTVSRVIKNSQSISQKTKEKVRRAMAELGYVPNVAAQMLATGLTYNIGLVFPPLIMPDRLNESFFMEMLLTITNEANQNHFTVSTATGQTVEELLSQVTLMHLQKRVDGFIVLYSKVYDPVVHYLSENNIPFVVVGSPFKNGIKGHYIDNDNCLMGREAVSFLHERGHQNILFITDDVNSEITSERFRGYVNGCHNYVLKAYDLYLFNHFEKDKIKELTHFIREEKITALINVGDILSVRMMQLLSYQGVKIPEDISIVTFNNSIFAKLIHPYLTTFDVNVKAIGKASFERLMAIMSFSNDTKESLTIIPFTLKIRESIQDISTK